jgi:hypothetical protein
VEVNLAKPDLAPLLGRDLAGADAGVGAGEHVGQEDRGRDAGLHADGITRAPMRVALRAATNGSP